MVTLLRRLVGIALIAQGSVSTLRAQSEPIPQTGLQPSLYVMYQRVALSPLASRTGTDGEAVLVVAEPKPGTSVKKWVLIGAGVGVAAGALIMHKIIVDMCRQPGHRCTGEANGYAIGISVGFITGAVGGWISYELTHLQKGSPAQVTKQGSVGRAVQDVVFRNQLSVIRLPVAY